MNPRQPRPEDPHEPARRLLQFIAESPSPFHAVASCCARLESAGFRELDEREAWTLKAGDRRFVVRNGSSLAAFVIGRELPSRAGFHLIGAHTDSPNLRIKPVPAIDRYGYHQAGVEVYGGALLASWTDRDLGLSGRVVIRGKRGRETRLVHIDRPIGRVPQLAIHLNRDVNEEGLKLNKEQHLVPILGQGVAGKGFLPWLAGELGVKPETVLAHDLMFHDLTPPALAGMAEEFICAGRLDNLASCHAALEALLGAAGDETPGTRGIVLYDSEEVGSGTAQGAAGSFLADLIERWVAARGESGQSGAQARARSFFISADMAHAVHPNYAERHEARHQPLMNGGPVLKVNANARYASDATSAAVFAQLAAEARVQVQRFVMRADLPCGSTIGPLVATRLGIKTVDVGNPMLSMHSAREMAGAADHGAMIQVLGRFFRAGTV